MLLACTYVSGHLRLANAVDYPGARRAAAARDPRADLRPRNERGRHRVGLRRDAAGDLATPGRTQGGRSRDRAAGGDEALLPRASRRFEGAPRVSRGLLDLRSRPAQARGGNRGKEEAWKQELVRL